MDFATSDDAERAVFATLHYVGPLVRAFEQNLEAAGFEIVSRRHQDGGGLVPSPVLVLRRDGREAEMHLGNAIEDFLFVDREESPLRVDPRLMDGTGYGINKMADIVESRIEIMEIALLPDGDEKDRRLRDVSDRFDWVRIARIRGDGES